MPLELLVAGYFAFELHDAERSRLQAFQNQQQLISKRLQAASTKQANATLQQRRTAITDALASDQNNLRRRLINERHQRLIQLPAGPGRHRATAAKAKGRRSAAR